MNKNKERLIELLKQARNHWDDYTDWGTGTWEEFYADHLLKNNVIVPPCKIGDTIFCTGYGIIEELTVGGASIEIHDDNSYYALVVAYRTNGTSEVFYFADFGQIVFTSREEAERKINGNDTNSNN